MKRRTVKHLDTNYQEKRREATLNNQRSARQQALEQARRAALEAAEEALQSGRLPPDDEDLIDQPSSSNDKQPEKSPAQFWASLFMNPEWLVEIPEDLGPAWYVAARPEGQRCIVSSSHGRTTVRLRTGRSSSNNNSVFASNLPGGGGPTTRQGHGEYCLLDCIYHEHNNTYYILDVMAWKGCNLYDCSAEFRLFWLQSKMQELGSSSNGQSIQAENGRQFVSLTYWQASTQGLQAAYTTAQPYSIDGLYLLHSQAPYTPGASTPLALLWKDPHTSKYFLETDASGVPLEDQYIVLQVLEDGATTTFGTSDDPPIILATTTAEQQHKIYKVGKLIRFKLGPKGIVFTNGHPSGADVELIGAGNQRRGRADSISKILFQYLARRNPISIESLLEGASSDVVDMNV